MKRPAGLSKSSKSSKKAKLDDAAPAPVEEALQVESTGSALSDLAELRSQVENAESIQEAVSWLRGLIHEANRLLSLRDASSTEDDNEETLPTSLHEWAQVNLYLGYGLYNLGLALHTGEEVDRPEKKADEPEDLSIWLEIAAEQYSSGLQGLSVIPTKTDSHTNIPRSCLETVLVLCHQASLRLDEELKIVSLLPALSAAIQYMLPTSYEVTPLLAQELLSMLSDINGHLLQCQIPSIDDAQVVSSSVQTILYCLGQKELPENEKALLAECRGDFAILPFVKEYERIVREHLGGEDSDEENDDEEEEECTVPEEEAEQLRVAYRNAISFYKEGLDSKLGSHARINAKIGEAYLCMGNVTPSGYSREALYQLAGEFGVEV